ncbi:MAG TPA: glycosyltransferase family 4 protein [Alphaproteobacteria bacterium]|nr:glycosyltransferase family 4 protein [Alphaproteobacteria bacterium]
MSERVCYLFHALGHTGGSLVLYRFMDELARLGYEVVAVTPKRRLVWHPTRSQEIVAKMAEGSLSPSGGFRPRIIDRARHVQVLRRLRGLLHARHPVEEVRRLTEGLLRQWVPSDFTIATLCTTAYAAYVLSDRTLSLYHMQHYEEVFFQDETWQKIARATYGLPLELMANSSWLQGRIRRWFGRESHLLLPGIDADVFSPRDVVERKYDNPEKFVILSYYSPVRFKAWEDALRAMELVYARLGSKRVEWQVFGGAPIQRPNLPINFVGRKFGTALAELYRRAHVVMMPSWYESFPLPPLEAMAAGTAVVATPIGTEDYVEEGRNALVIPPRDPPALADAIVSLIRHPDRAARLARGGVETAGRFTWERAAEHLHAILQRARASPLQQYRREIAELLPASLLPGDGRRSDVAGEGGRRSSE